MRLKPYLFTPRKNQDGSPVLDYFQRPQHDIAYNEVKDSVRGFHFGQKPKLGATIVITANGEAEIEFDIDSQGSFDWTHLIGASTGDYTIQFFDPGRQTRIMNRPIHSGTIIGTGRRPFALAEPYLFNVEDKERRMIAKLYDLSGGTNTVRLYLYGRRYYEREAKPFIGQTIKRSLGNDWRTNAYFLAVDEADRKGTPPPILANGDLTHTFTMDHDEDTDIQKMMVVSTGAFEFNLRDVDTGRTLSNKPIHVDNGWGTAQFPFYLSDTWLLERNKELKLEMTDLSGADNTVYATLAGRRLVGT